MYPFTICRTVFLLYLQDGFCYSHFTNEEIELEGFKCLVEGRTVTGYRVKL